MSNSYQARNANPALYLVPQEDPRTGVFALMVLMSGEHYGLIMCLRDSDCLTDPDVTLIGEQIVQPWANQFPFLVEMYQDRFGEHLQRFPVFRTDVPYCFEFIQMKRMDLKLKLPEGSSKNMDFDEKETRYLFVGPEGVPFEEFITFAEGTLLN
jgi:hypothetical protein